ncbi:MAG: ORF6N domain-containing protein [Bacteroidales bacterium]|nr:ORF6N domain-containing protein [Bacteroidales bacterium]
MENDIAKINSVEDKIIEVRGEKVLLDSDVAALYGVKTMRVNEAVKNNPEKFPEGYIFKLTKEEKSEVIEIFDNPNVTPKSEVVENFDHLKLKFSPTTPTAFTEKGLYMLATILKSERATQTTIAIVETFAKIRELSRTVAELSATGDQFAQKNLMQKSGDIMADILGSDLQTTGTETSMELNLAVLKFKHTIKRKSE